MISTANNRNSDSLEIYPMQQSPEREKFRIERFYSSTLFSRILVLSISRLLSSPSFLWFYPHANSKKTTTAVLGSTSRNGNI